MNTKPPFQTPSFGSGGSTATSPASPTLCFSSSKQHKHENTGLCGCRRAPKTKCISAIGILILVIAYTAVGSVLFVTLEGEIEENDTIETAVAASKPFPRNDNAVNSEMRSRTVDRLWSITEDLNILYKENWTRLAAQEVQLFQETFLRAIKASKSQQITNTQSVVKAHKWTYASAFLYSLTLITTIGYGGISPKTQWGRIAALLYALFGIPMVLLYLSAMGESLSSLMRCFFKRIRSTSTSSSSASSSNNSSSASSNASGVNTKTSPSLNGEKRPHPSYPTNSWNTTQLSTSLNNYSSSSSSYVNGAAGATATGTGCKKHRQSVVPISICILILICYVTLGAVLFHKIQPWGVLESLYFCFTSLGTIGFGDLQPSGQFSQYMASGYILVGMAVVAMCFSLIQTELIIWLRKFGVQDSYPTNQQLNEELGLVTVALTPIKSS